MEAMIKTGQEEIKVTVRANLETMEASQGKRECKSCALSYCTGVLGF
jgi:hypothetical protein